MPLSITVPFGAWPSPITSERVATAQTTLIDVLLHEGVVYWIEGRPLEAGRHVLVRLGDDGAGVDVTPQPFSARTRVHEYGGGAVALAAGAAYFSNFADQRLYRLDGSGVPTPLTLAPASNDAVLRYADGQIDATRHLWIGIREDHRTPGAEAANTLVALGLGPAGGESVLVQGSDFYASPRLSPDGRLLAWLAWDHPDMPWTATRLWVGEFDGAAVTNAVMVAGGPGESVFQPEWSPDGLLHYVSDRSGWWNIYRREASGAAVNLCPRTAEFGRAQWGFGMSTYAFVSADQLVCTYTEDGTGKLALLNLQGGALTPFDLPFTEFSSVRASAGRIAFKAGSPTVAGAVVVLDAASGHAAIVRNTAAMADDPTLREYISTPRLIEFPTSPGETAFALFYPPANADCHGPPGSLPPLLVKCHGGPTSSASRSLDLRTQFWTSRGIAVVDVDYGGSTGYGRAYRDRLHRMWGIVDARDCGAAASYLAANGLVDAARMVITGGSAGGFTALSCLTHADPALRGLFRAGASHYGVSDPEALTRDTHKFESRYMDWLIAPYSDAGRQTYIDRSPVRNAGRIGAPVAFFQGTEDRIVPPSQTEEMVAALRRRGISALYLLFAGEQHGFRQAIHIQWALDAELYFYAALAWR
ncbi:dipeptidyl-peptidase 5 [Variovorax sp. PBL-E5]|uniref:dipeptidyl-peptidase 5 n=1 Tax=Variovorax sp. PBL-E5 TaxID=434014 RepID=UPI001318BE22|nr:prolyl oligopeptidase family serine peptidase [Variovorax sp. PBL-E5]VTU34758.1 Prolyl tripeptidyl peptidase precursor [Variovorax sp. PBL-E5]